MTDWREAGRKADAHRIRDLYRKEFNEEAKGAARRRVVAVLKVAGGTTCLDLWGGGASADQLTAAGFNVISVDDGTMQLFDRESRISNRRKRRALETAASEGGYQSRWGKATAFAAEADVAFLDFCGPWSREARLAVEACRHMKAVVVTLLTDHDINTGSTTQHERLLAYQAFLKLAYSGEKPGIKTLWSVPCRLLVRYKRTGGQPVLVFVLSRARLPNIGALPWLERMTLDPAQRAAKREYSRARALERYNTDPEYRDRILDRAAKDRKHRRERFLNDAEFRERRRLAGREYQRRCRARRKATSAEPPFAGDP